MNPKRLKKLILVNLGIILVNIFIFSKAFLGLSVLEGSVLARTVAVFSIVASCAVFLDSNVKLLQKPPETRKMLSANVDSLEDCIKIFEVAIQHGDVFDNDCLKNIKQIKRFQKKKSTIKDILTQKFSPEELTYQKFSGVLADVENVLYLNVRSILNKIAAFDVDEYEELQKRGFPKHEVSEEKMEIYKEYLTFVRDATYINEEILLKMDKMLFEITRYNTLDGGDIKALPAISEMDELIKNAKLYK